MEGLYHTGITVSDLERSVQFYRDTLGLQLVVEPTLPSGGDELSRALDVPEANLRLAVFRIGQASLELLQYLNPVSPLDAPAPLHALGAMHVAFRVSDIEAEVTRLASQGVRFNGPIQENTEGPLAGWRWVYFRDPDGISLELIEVADI